MSRIAIEILVLVVLILANALFAMSEIAVVSARKTRLQQQAQEGNKRAQVALELANAPNQFLATIQLGITLVGIMAGAFGGATIAEELAGVLEQVPFLAPYSEVIGVGIVVLTITYFSLVIGELIPKRLGLNNAERVAARLAPFMRALSRLASPLVRLLSLSTDLAMRLLRVRPKQETPVSEEEIKLMAGHFAAKPMAVTAQKLDPDKVVAGEKLYAKNCSKCHDEYGRLADDDAGILASQ